MKKMFYPLLAIVIMSLSAFTLIKAPKWAIEKEYSVKFTFGRVEGAFSGLQGIINFDPANCTQSKLDVSINAAAVNTGNGMKNQRIRDKDWLDADKYPVITFTSTQIVQTSDGYEAKGMLGLHGIKKEITIPFNFANSTFTGAFSFARADFNLNVSDTDYADTISINLSVPVTKQ
jgi:polyisoprenoid-binding protein YceI